MEDGALLVFSVDTEEQARSLITFTCPTNYEGEYYAPELAEEQTLENLYAFSDRLTDAWNKHVKSDCDPEVI